jgi:restriction system protein
MKSYYRVMLGPRSAYARECFAGGYIGVNLSIHEDLTRKLPEQWREFNKAFIPVWLAAHPEKTKISAGLACGALWTVAKGIAAGDLVLCPDGAGSYRAGEVLGGYYYVAGEALPHRRKVRWLDRPIARSGMGEALRNATGSIGTVSEITDYHDEIERLLAGTVLPGGDPGIEDPGAFAMEKHLEDFLVQNWARTELGREYDVYEEEGERVGQQYPTDTGAIDILAISKDKKRLLVVELKRGRASDVVVGQAMRYMGYVQDELAEEGQTVQGIIIALEDDPKIRRALAMMPSIAFYRYQVSFRLVKG